MLLSVVIFKNGYYSVLCSDAHRRNFAPKIIKYF